MVRTSGIQFEQLSLALARRIWRAVTAFVHHHSPHLTQFWQGGLTVIAIMVLGKAISLGWKLVIVRLGPETLGTTQLILTALTLLTSFSLLGMQTTLGRFASIAWHQHQYARAQQLLVLSLKWCGGLGITLALGCWLGPELIKTVLKLPAVSASDLRLLGLAVPLAVASELAWSFLAAQRRVMTYGLTRYVLLPVARLGLLVALMMAGLPVTQIIVWHLVGAVVISASLTWILGRLPRSLVAKPLPEKYRKQLVKYALSIAGSFILFMVYGSTDVLLLNHFGSLEVVGLLSALFIFTELADIFFTGFLNLFQSFLSAFHKDPVAGWKFTLLTSAGLLIGGLLVTTVLTTFRGLLISWLLGPEYQSISQIIGLALIIKTLESSIVFSLHHFLDFYGYVKVTVALMAIGLVVKVAAGWLLIAQYGLTGVLYTQGVAVLFQIIACVVLISGLILTKPSRWSIVKSWLKLE